MGGVQGGLRPHSCPDVTQEMGGWSQREGRGWGGWNEGEGGGCGTLLPCSAASPLVLSCLRLGRGDPVIWG